MPQHLLSNQLILAVRPELRPAIATYRDLARPGLLLAIGDRQVPVGHYTRLLLAGLAADPDCGPELVARIERNVVSEENQAKAILTKLLLGEADAGIIYRSDLATASARRLIAIPLPTQHLPPISYPLARVRGGTGHSDSFVDFLFSEPAQRIFARYGLQREEDR